MCVIACVFLVFLGEPVRHFFAAPENQATGGRHKG